MRLRLCLCLPLFAAVLGPRGATAAVAAPSTHVSSSRLGLGDLSDAMNPANPFNGGVEPMPLPGDARMVVFTYNQDQIFRVLAAPLKVTTIEFERDEQLASEPAQGENVRWEVATDGANHVYVKPHAAGLVNTLSINTNKRSYEFTLVSSPLGGIFYQKIRFRVPSPLMDKVRTRADLPGSRGDGPTGPDAIGVPPDKLNFDYRVSGKADFKPEVVFDDSKGIWMRIPKTASEWPVALIKDGSDFVVANFIRRGDFLVLQRMAEVVALRSGDNEVTVERGKRGFFGW